MFEQAFKNINDVLWKDAGCTSELDYTEQTSWLLFLKYLDALEQDKATEAALVGKKYTHILDAPYRWEAWAAPKKDGKIDHNTALTGDDLIRFVNGKLFPYEQNCKEASCCFACEAALALCRLPRLNLSARTSPEESFPFDSTAHSCCQSLVSTSSAVGLFKAKSVRRPMAQR